MSVRGFLTAFGILSYGLSLYFCFDVRMASGSGIGDADAVVRSAQKVMSASVE